MNLLPLLEGAAVLQLLLAAQAALNLRLMRRLKPETTGVTDGMAPLTVCLPMRNEAANAERLLTELLAEREELSEILILDDGSTDATPAILARFKEQHPGLIRVVNGAPKPAEWKGKIWAMAQLEREVRTDLMLFLDADVSIAAGAIRSLRAAHAASGARYFSVFPQQRTPGASGLLIGHIYTSLVYALPMAFASRRRPASIVAGCGQVQLISRAALATIGGFAPLAGTLHDGLQLARRHKRYGHPVQFADGGSYIACTMYGSFGEAWKGFQRNAFEATGGLLPLMIMSAVLLTVFVLMPSVSLALLVEALFGIACYPVATAAFLIVPTFLILLLQHRVDQRFALRPGLMWRLPVSVLLAVAVQSSSYVRHRLGITSEWRGRDV